MFMAILRSEEIRKMKPEEVDKKLEDLKKEKMKIKMQIGQGTVPEKPGRVKEVRRAIARILTVRKEKKKESVKNK
jgi:large subunit ribosomal protein L29